MAVREWMNLSTMQDGLLLLLVLGSACAIGGVHAHVLVVLAVAAVAFTVIAILRKPFNRYTPTPPVLFWCLVVAGLWAAVQSLPLGGMIRGVPGSMAHNWALAGIGSSRLSGNYPATLLMSVRCFAAAALLYGVFRFFGRPEQLNRLIVLIVGSGAVVAVLALVQGWLRVDSLLFLYEPRMGPVRAGLQGPFVNPDHFGAYMAVCALLTLGRSLTLVFHRVRYAYHGLFCLLFAGLVLSASLSACFGFAVGFLTIALVWGAHKRRIKEIASVGFPLMGMGLVVAGGLYKFGFVAGIKSALIDQLKAWSRVGEIWSDSLGIVWSNGLVGIGSGSLRDMLAIHLAPPVLSVWYTRNQVVQTLVDFGIPIGGLLLAGVLISLRCMFVRWHHDHHHMAMPMISAIAGLAAISLTDFALEVPAIGIVGLLLLGSLAALSRRYRNARSEPQREKVVQGRVWFRSSLRERLILGGLISLMAAVSLFCLASQHRFNRAEEHFESLLQSVRDDDVDVAEIASAATGMLAFRPARGRTYTAVGEAYLRTGYLELARDWLQKAVHYLPNDSYTLRLFGTTLLRSRQVEPAIAYLRSSMAIPPEQDFAVISGLVEETRSRTVWASVASDEASREMLVQVLLNRERYLDALSFAALLLEYDAHSRVGLEAAASASVSLGLDALGRYYAQHLLDVDPTNAAANLAFARLEQHEGQLDMALERVVATTQSVPDDPRLWLMTGELLLEQWHQGTPPVGFRERMDEVLTHLRPIALSQPQISAPFHTLVIRYYLALENWRAVVSSAGQAIEVAPAQPFWYHSLARALYELGDIPGSRDAQERARQLGGITTLDDIREAGAASDGDNEATPDRNTGIDVESTETNDENPNTDNSNPGTTP